MTRLLIPALLAACVCAAQAKDLGVQGTVFPIVELDMRQLMREELEKADISRVQEEVKASAKRYIANLPKRSLPAVETTKTSFIDLSVTLSSAIQVPVKQPDGSWQWKVMYPAGTKVNPLDGHRPTKAMLFIDGSEPDQIQLAKRVLALAGSRVHVVEAGQGNLEEDNKALDIGTFYGDDRLLARFQVTALPSLLYAAEGVNKAYMALTAFGRPFKAEDGTGWNVLRTKLAEEAKEKRK